MKLGLYIAGQADDGLGHVYRGLGISRALGHLGHEVTFTGPISNAVAKILDENKESYRVQPFKGVGALIIDAVDYKPEFLSWIATVNKTLLTSPSFSRTDLVTHMFSRVQTTTSDSVSKAGGFVSIDPMYAFSGVTRDQFDHSVANTNRTIGICITGGSTYVDLDVVVDGCASVDTVSMIKVVGDTTFKSTRQNKVKVQGISHTSNLWRNFYDIDFLITGDGITMFEGMARGIPTLSISRPGAAEKNQYFYEGNWCANLETRSLSESQVAGIVDDLKWASECHAFLINKDLTLYENLLAHHINRVLGGGDES